MLSISEQTEQNILEALQIKEWHDMRKNNSRNPTMWVYTARVPDGLFDNQLVKLLQACEGKVSFFLSAVMEFDWTTDERVETTEIIFKPLS